MTRRILVAVLWSWAAWSVVATLSFFVGLPAALSPLAVTVGLVAFAAYRPRMATSRPLSGQPRETSSRQI